MRRLYPKLLLLALPLAAAPTFDSIRPIFNARCAGCHNEKVTLGKLSLANEQALLKGGESGPAIVPGDAAKSLLIDKIVTRQMPPGKEKLNDAEIDQIRLWINGTQPVQTASVTEHEIRGILQARCVACHGAARQAGGLDLRTVASRLKGGKSGPALVAGKPDESLMLARIVKGEMPPAREAKQLAIELPTDGEVNKIRAWIASGAQPAAAIAADADAIKDKDREFWAFQPPVAPVVPKVKNARLVRNAIDAFLLEKLEAKSLSYNAEAPRHSLLRRVYIDLTGLPPTPAEVAAFMSDKRPDAYEQLVDRLLASPRYGERWGQHWLDLAGYADSEGFGQDDGVRRYAWRYRDYVIRALNADKPYNQFLKEQLAGDELSNDWRKMNGAAPLEVIDRLAATGFLRTTPDPTNSNERGLIAERMNVLADETEVLASSVMGLTIGCARCHNHKYDPIPQRDYYRLSAILQGSYDPYEWRSPNKREQSLALADEIAAVEKVNGPIEMELKRVEAAIAAKPPAEKLEALRKERNELRGKLKPRPHTRILSDNAEPSQSYLLRRGDPVSFGDPVEPNVPQVLRHASLKPFKIEAPYPETSGRRLALAEWLTQPNHPLTARVAVNQMWMRHFGRGIVPTVANFGRSGLPPANQQLLDYLATEFVARGWSMKAMHRLMVTSQAYRQSSAVSEALLAVDPENALLSRMPLQRMDAETLYDSLLLASSRLDDVAFGPPAETRLTEDKEVLVKVGANGYRRSIYTLKRRQTPVSLLDAFDQPAMTPNCTERRKSNVATQALHLFNGSHAWELSRYLAGRLIDEHGASRREQVNNLYLRAYARQATATEMDLALSALEQFEKEWPARLKQDHQEAPVATQANWLALANLCHAILNSAEFSFID